LLGLPTLRQAQGNVRRGGRGRFRRFYDIFIGEEVFPQPYLNHVRRGVVEGFGEFLVVRFLARGHVERLESPFDEEFVVAGVGEDGVEIFPTCAQGRCAVVEYRLLEFLIAVGFLAACDFGV